MGEQTVTCIISGVRTDDLVVCAGLWLWDCCCKKQGKWGGGKCLFIHQFRAGPGLMAVQADLNLAVPKIQIALIAPGEVELVALDVREQTAAVRSGPATGRARPTFRALAMLPQANPHRAKSLLALLSSLVSEEREKSQLEWLQCEVPPSQPRPNQNIYPIKTPV